MPLDNLRFFDEDDDLLASLPSKPEEKTAELIKEESTKDADVVQDEEVDSPLERDNSLILGISLSSLVALEDKLRSTFDENSETAEDEIEAVTFRQMVETHIAPILKANDNKSYIQCLEPEASGKPDFFVSFSSSQSFVNVLSDVRGAAIMLLPEKEEDQIFCYIDQLAICRPPSVTGTEEILNVTKSAIDESLYTLLVMDELGEVFSLTWILFHLWSTKSGLRVVCNEVINAPKVAKALTGPAFAPLTSKCRDGREKQAIFDNFKAEGAIRGDDVETLRKAIVRGLLDSSLQEIQDLSSSESAAPQEYLANAQTKAGAFYQALGDLSSATSCHEKAAELMEKIGHQDGLLACSELALGEVLATDKSFKRAEERLRKAFEIQTSIGSIQHPDALRAGRKLAVVLKRNGKLQESRELSQKVYDATKAMSDYGPNHMVTAGAAIQLAVVLKKLKRFDEAEGKAKEALSIFDRQADGKTSQLSLQTVEFLRDLAKKAKNRAAYDQWKAELESRSPRKVDEEAPPVPAPAPDSSVARQKSVRRETDMF